MEYDEFFLHDNDFGSDADSDGEGIAAAAIQKRDGMEILGPCYLQNVRRMMNVEGTISESSTTRLTSGTRHRESRELVAYKLDGEGNTVMCSDREKDVIRLRAYAAVVYAPTHMLPVLDGSVVGSKLSVEKKVKDTPTTGSGSNKRVELTDDQVKVHRSLFSLSIILVKIYIFIEYH